MGMSAEMMDPHVGMTGMPCPWEVLVNTEHVNNTGLQLCRHHSSGCAVSSHGCMVRACSRADVAAVVNTHHQPGTVCENKGALNASGRSNHMAWLVSQTLCRVEALVLSPSGTASAPWWEGLKD